MPNASNPEKRELMPSSTDWCRLEWREPRGIGDLYLDVQHTHADKPHSGKESKEELHFMLNPAQMLALYQTLHNEVVAKLKETTIT